MTAAKEKAYAKINLYLDVISRRDDGFHNIKTVMHSVSLCDDITVSVKPAAMCRVNISMPENSHLPHDDKNLAVRAAKAFTEKLGVSDEVNIKLVKRIPVSAGLAGGSSDAAAVLRALNRIYKRPFTAAALSELGASIGSDVPYCVVGRTALCEGRGERVQRIDASVKLNVVIASSSEHVSTPEAYRMLDDKYSCFDGSISRSGEAAYEKISRALSTGAICRSDMFNIFEEVVLSECPKARAIIAALTSMGGAAMMSGSGPAVFGIFDTARAAQNARDSLLAAGYRAWTAVSV